MQLSLLALALLTLVGHAALWVGFTNRVHATGAPRWLVKILSGFSHAILAGLPLAATVLWWRSGLGLNDWLAQFRSTTAWLIYFIPCWMAAAIAIAFWLWRHSIEAPRTVACPLKSKMIDVAARLGRKPVAGTRARLLSIVPGNEAWQLEIRELNLALPRLPGELEGLSIVQLSDFHFTGRIEIDFFQAVVDEANALRPDLIVLCGDLVDEAHYFGWIPQTLGRFSATHGVYYILGNHDVFTGDLPRLRNTLDACGLIDVGGRWRSLSVQRAEVILAGNELPWITPAADMEHCPPRHESQLRVLLSHSPDQFGWACRWDFDLMLAGHTHGGQIRLPLVGAIFSPCRAGVRYAAGTFYSPPTVMHVSRGISAEQPVRLGCRPELTKIVLSRAVERVLSPVSSSAPAYDRLYSGLEGE